MRPDTPLIYLLLAWLVLGIGAAFSDALTVVWQLSFYGLLALAGLDMLWLHQIRQLRMQRKVAGNLPVAAWSDVTLSLRHSHNLPLHLSIHDHHPTSAEIEGLPQKLVLPPLHQADCHYRIRPQQRGDDIFRGLDILIRSPLKLWKKRFFIDQKTDVRVYPNFAEVAHYSLLATDNRLSQIGVKRRQRRGEGNDFRQLREYRLGDSPRQIDWKATSRYNKLISREYQDERDQQIVFLLDCGRRMRHVEDGQAHLDQALNSLLLLSHVATNQGDAAGMLSFAGTERWFAPKKGSHVVTQLLEQTYDLNSTTEAADYIGNARKLLSLQRKRSLILLMTNTRNEDIDELQQAVRLLSRRHLVVLADLREPVLNDTLRHEIDSLDQAIEYHGVQDYLFHRKQCHETLQHAGAICIDTTAKELPVRLVNQYLDIKRTGRL